MAGSLNIDELYKKLVGDDSSKASDIPISNDIDKEISTFLAKKSLLTENDIVDYAKYLAMEHGDDNSVEKDLIQKIFIRVILLKLKK